MWYVLNYWINCSASVWKERQVVPDFSSITWKLVKSQDPAPTLDQWFSHFSMHQNSFGHHWPHLQNFWFSKSAIGAQELTFLTTSKRMRLLLAWIQGMENHCWGQLNHNLWVDTGINSFQPLGMSFFSFLPTQRNLITISRWNFGIFLEGPKCVPCVSMDALSGYEERNTVGQGLEVWQENPEAGFLSIQRPSLLESGPTSCQTCKQPKVEKTAVPSFLY